MKHYSPVDPGFFMPAIFQSYFKALYRVFSVLV